MARHAETGEFMENDKFEDKSADSEKVDKAVPKKPYKIQLVWRNIIFLGCLHLAALYGFYLVFTSAKLATTLFAIAMVYSSGLGVTAGAHRLWCHRSYKAKWPLRLLFTVLNTIAFQDSIIDWSRDHRIHHKYSDTNADPYNASRGFFFSHVGWLLCRKHPDVKEKGKGIDLSDLYSDPILRFQKKYYTVLMPLCCFVIPMIVPVYCWNESWSNAFYVAVALRWIALLNITWLVNSFAHLYGNKPYEKSIYPSENALVSILSFGEGWHNYHHAFPWDYRAAELNFPFNFTTSMINLFARMGLAYDMKTVSTDLIRKRAQRTGDGSHELWGSSHENTNKEDKRSSLTSHCNGVLHSPRF